MSAEDQILGMAATASDRLTRSVLHLERIAWARWCELMVEAIDSGSAPAASGRAAFSAMAKSLREAAERVKPAK